MASCASTSQTVASSRTSLRGYVVSLLLIVVAFGVVDIVPSTSAGDDSASSPERNIRISTSSGNVAVSIPNRWKELRLGITNPTSDEVNLLCVSFFEQEPNLQFGRRVWLPPKSQFITSHPVRVPARVTPDDKMVTFRSFVIREGTDESGLIPQQGGALQIDQSAFLDDQERVLGLLDSSPLEQPGRIEIAELLVLARDEANLSKPPLFAPSRHLSATEEGLDGLDHLVIADSRLVSDPAGLEALRTWLFGGGRLWVMLDRVEPQLLERLLGNDCEIQTVDRIGRTEIAFESLVPGASVPTTSVFYDSPVDHVRVLANGFDTVYSVEGWPAALTKSCGQGTLLVTTLAADGWARPRTDADSQPTFGTAQGIPFVALPPATYLSLDFFKPRGTAPLSQSTAEEHLRGYIGYSIPARGLILSVLFAFTVVLGGVGVWFARRDKLERFGLIGPIVALVASAVLLFCGHRQRRDVPSTTAFVQFVQPVTGTSHLRVTGTAALFAPDTVTANIGGTHGGWLLPDATGQDQTARRLVWNDSQTWHWENVRSATGLRFAAFRASMTQDVLVRAQLTLDESGGVGTLTLPPVLHPTDGVLATPSGRIGVNFQTAGTWVAGANQVLAAEQYLAADVLNDEQHRRLQTLKEVFEGTEHRPFPEEPTLLFWTKPWDVGVRFSDAARTSEPQSNGAALVAIPVTIERPAVGRSVTIPAPLLGFRESFGPEGSAPSGLFDNRRRQWSEKSRPTSTWFRFQIPLSLLPVETQSARLTVRVSGPVGKLEIAKFADGQIVPLQLWNDPIGTLTFDINDSRSLPMTHDGGLFFRIAAGDPDRPELTLSNSESRTADSLSYWKIESLSLELKARISESRSTMTSQ